MKCYVIQGDNETIYEGNAVKQRDESQRVQYNVNIINYYAYDKDAEKWLKWPGIGETQNFRLANALYQGRVTDYPSVQVAENACNALLK